MRNITPKTPLHDNCSKALRHYSALRGKSIKEIAEGLDIPAQTVSAWNTGRYLPDMDRLQRLADYLEAPISQFFRFTALETEEDKELSQLIEELSKDKTQQDLLKTFSQLSDEDKTLLSLLALRLNK